MYGIQEFCRQAWAPLWLVAHSNRCERLLECPATPSALNQFPTQHPKPYVCHLQLLSLMIHSKSTVHSVHQADWSPNDNPKPKMTKTFTLLYHRLFKKLLSSYLQLSDSFPNSWCILQVKSFRPQITAVRKIQECWTHAGHIFINHIESSQNFY